MRQREEFQAEEVQKLKIKMDCANLLVTEGKVETITVEAEGSDKFEYTCTCEMGKLKIRQKGKNRGVIHQTMPFQITVKVPAGKQFEKISIKCGAGDADLTQAKVDAECFKLETGAGNVVFGELTAAETCNVSSGAGNVRIGRVHAKDMSINCGAGNFEMQGKIEQNLDANCGVGNLTIRLEGKEEDYNFETSCGIGKITTNHSYAGCLAPSQSRVNPDAVGTIRLNSGIGKIDLAMV